MLELMNLSLPLDAGLPGKEDLMSGAAAQALNIKKESIASCVLVKRSVDARKKQNVHFVASVRLAFVDEQEEQNLLKLADKYSIKPYHPYKPLDIPCLARSSFDLTGEEPSGSLESTTAQKSSASQRGSEGEKSATMQPAAMRPATMRQAAMRPAAMQPAAMQPVTMRPEAMRPVVVGTGPAGLFAALYLAKAGLRPLVLEQGMSVEQRLNDVARFNRGGALNPQSNIQFGEGGAGTFSDGKLTTNIKSPYASHVLHWFYEAGAPESILWEAKPHIGTDHLVSIVKNMREQIISLGGEVRFGCQLSNLIFSNSCLSEVELSHVADGRQERLTANALILATGHSARDTFSMLYEAGVKMEQKPFSIGVRIEHRQADINVAQYGAFADHPALGAADYKLAVHLPGGRSVYSFCMCPGGEVVCATSEEAAVVVNGMSRFARDAKNANSALLVSVDPTDFESEHPLAGIELQRHIERRAYSLTKKAGDGSYQAPAQTVGDFLNNTYGTVSPVVDPSYARGVVWCDLGECLPGFVIEALREALPLFGRKLKGFASEHAVLTGVETRSSSPVRVCRDEGFHAVVRGDSRAGVYPCGEGAGYAGGIMSAAVDGLRVAEALVRDIISDESPCS